MSFLEEVIDELVRITRRLRTMGMVLFAGLLSGIVTAVIGRTQIDPEYNYNFEAELALTLAIIIALAGLVGTAVWEMWNKRGRTVSQELTDQVQEMFVTGDDIEREESRLRWRVSVRDFERASDLPLLPGRFGPTIYAALFATIALLSAVWWP